jgi:hypothetical protein
MTNYRLLILSAELSELDRVLLRLAQWVGIEAKLETISDPDAFVQELSQGPRNGDRCVALSAETLAILLKRSGKGIDLNRLFPQHVQCLIYGFESVPSHAAVLQGFGDSGIEGLESLPEGSRRFQFAKLNENWLRPLGGLDYCEESSAACDAFRLRPSASAKCTPIICANDSPVFVRWSAGSGKEFFLWATKRIADVAAPLPPGTALEDWYPWLLPAIIFLKASFGFACWHSPYQRARLIIDDPPLRSQYGFLRYDELLESMQRVQYGSSIAFIPWNYRRSKRPIAKLFLLNPSRLSLCIHGCDHTNHEFDSDNEQGLEHKANLAQHRMDQHRRISGVTHENVMVFPQGHFSVAATRALRTSGFLAAVNSSCSPTHNGGTLTLGDLLLPAVSRYHGFPIFPRRDPIRIFDVAVDLFLGKAAFIVEHHEFVRDGYDTWEQFATRMNDLDDRLAWPPLVDTVTETCLQKIVGEDRIEVRFFTPLFKWRNPSDRSVHVHFNRYDPEPSLIREIRVDGQAVPYEVRDSFIHFDRMVSPRSVINVTVIDQTVPSTVAPKARLADSLSAGLRRYLSEFRDNTLVRHPVLLGCAKSAVQYFKLTSHSR